MSRAADRREGHARHPSVGGNGLDLAPQFEPLPDDDRQFVENFRQVAARALLQHDRGHEEVNVE